MPSPWTVECNLPDFVDPRETEREALSLATAIKRSLRRYDPPHRKDALNTVIARLTRERDKLHTFLHSDDGKVTG